jgi:hypothetical protein
MNAYSKDLRLRVLTAYRDGFSRFRSSSTTIFKRSAFHREFIRDSSAIHRSLFPCVQRDGCE